MRRIVAVGILLGAIGCGGADGPSHESVPSEAPPREAVDRARGAADDLGQELMARLVRELGKGSDVEAMRVCASVAQEIAASHSVDGLSVRRVSLRARNAADVPDEFEERKLRMLEELHVRGQLPKEFADVVQGDGGSTLRYLRPIVVMEPCLKCHGAREAMAPEVVAFLDERYPGDPATGYRAGDLRGAVSVAVVLD